MWDLDNSTPYAAGAHWIRDKDGAHRWLVAVKGTFSITAHGQVMPIPVQPEPVLVPLYRAAPASSSLLLDSDLLAEKPGTEILVDACAYAPNGRAVERVEVALQAGSVRKTLLVYGPRIYMKDTGGLTMSDPLPFTTQPIHYEWAFGGSDLESPDVRERHMDARNPVGKGVAADVSKLYDQPAHVIEYPQAQAANAGPAGFGPLASFWSPRRERAGTYDSRWEQARKPLLPDDYDPWFAMSAPEDQWCAAPLQAGDLISLSNMCPEGMLQFSLPAVSLNMQTMFGTRAVEHPVHLCCLIVSPSLRQFSMVWQSSLPVRLRDIDYLDFTYIAGGA